MTTRARLAAGVAGSGSRGRAGSPARAPRSAVADRRPGHPGPPLHRADRPAADGVPDLVAAHDGGAPAAGDRPGLAVDRRESRLPLAVRFLARVQAPVRRRAGRFPGRPPELIVAGQHVGAAPVPGTPARPAVDGWHTQAVILGYVLAVLAAVASGSGSILESAGVRRAGAFGGSPQDLVALRRQPLYFLGVGVDLLGFVFAAAALHRL